MEAYTDYIWAFICFTAGYSGTAWTLPHLRTANTSLMTLTRLLEQWDWILHAAYTHSGGMLTQASASKFSLLPALCAISSMVQSRNDASALYLTHSGRPVSSGSFRHGAVKVMCSTLGVIAHVVEIFKFCHRVTLSGLFNAEDMRGFHERAVSCCISRKQDRTRHTDRTMTTWAAASPSLLPRQRQEKLRHTHQGWGVEKMFNGLDDNLDLNAGVAV
ncbi:hypothetical protein V8B97DRAFT_994728 [Scleroderma yunnanense]